MSNEVRIYSVQVFSEVLSDSLSRLLIDVVADGASIGFLPPLGYQEAAAYWNSVLEDDVVLWIAERDGVPVGTVQLQLAQKANATHRAEIAKLMVHPSGRRLGIARQLMNAAEEEAVRHNRTLLVLDTRVGDPSNRLYESIGFVEAGVIPNYAQSADGQLHATRYYYKPLNPYSSHS
ncbi:GNAT family N-acetyltransferase [Paenibacillus polymyxa]|uniref:GNAT family N-acetyltransferase n=1 Tax=Paenibacillus polymyxa TaxID=1406 RepID=UPI000D8EC764|nr:GNAT family N-acetyltransferase [Paenibacillus polymyxa]MBE3646536.1 GNAT family N-acetyltransferase [Paenibacillus polymyxa]MDU8672224.1 GNAT family N-acetyltransferase [Paenibacillus polymyxa]MDU8697133.1 GNAT family N-acetyltransferase [Paenibacillus polymyxa]UQQ33916.1 GNAT family N-acetyltransferase [Paenibacillus polymyxa]URJ35002.1 GNAT family N-acetyltransferase [Paenibacillus polymyxa]